jgi:drug/metabolite transporter (DMT)-like permease
LLGEGGQSIGILLCLGAASSYGLGSLWTKVWLKNIPPLTMATGQLLLSSVIMTVLAFGFDKPVTLLDASAESWMALLGLSLLATSFAYILFFRVVARSGPANVLLVTMMIPASAIIMGYAVLNETLEPREITGALIIIIALVIIDGRALRYLRPGQQAT